MRVYPKPLEVGDLEGFTPEKDLFNRAELGRSMSHLVATVEDPLVIAFDGPWGSGKTTFLKMWAGELRKAGHPVIFFDAFENDYVEDAFAALAREIVELAESKIPVSSEIVDSFRKNASKLGIALLKGGLKIGAKVVIHAATAGAIDTDQIKMIADDAEKEAGDIAKKYIDELLDKPHKQREITKDFKKSLEELPALLRPEAEPKDQQSKSLIFIIDELDRCKPHFALSLLERIKHFMTVPNVHFVLGVHLRQMYSSIRYAYGQDIDAALYLQKFVNITILNTVISEHEKRSDLHIYANHLSRMLDIRQGTESPLSTATGTIIRLANSYSMSYRTLERAFTILAMAIGFTPENRLQLGNLIGGLVIMKLTRSDLYMKAKNGYLDYAEAKEFLRFDSDTNRFQEMTLEQKWWAYSLMRDAPSEIINFGNDALFRYSIDDRFDLVKYTANDIVDRISPYRG